MVDHRGDERATPEGTASRRLVPVVKGRIDEWRFPGAVCWTVGRTIPLMSPLFGHPTMC
jgi:hypothetical protein